MKVANGQSLLDVAIQGAGTIEAALDVAIKNNVSVTDDLSAGAEIAIPTVQNKAVANYYAARSIRPATQVDMPNDTTIFEEVFDEMFE